MEWFIAICWPLWLECCNINSNRVIPLLLSWGIFGDYGKPAKQVAMEQLMGAKMVEGTLVREYVLKMIGYLSELETLGTTIDAQTWVISSLTHFMHYSHNSNLITI